MKLLVVESPNKVSKIQGYLNELEPGQWRVLPTVGHWRGLPAMDGLVFADAVDPTTWNERFSVHKEDVAGKLGAALKLAQGVYLATDPDREGEAIAWHVVDHFRLRDARRVLFTEITKTALAAAIARPGPLDMNLVEAQRARQVLDYEFGLEVSRRLWRFGCRSAGRVQSAALRILVDRENAIRNFKSEPFWSVFADYDGFSAAVAVFERLSTEEIDDEGVDAGDAAATVRLKPQRFTTQAEACAIVAAGQRVPHVVERVDSKPTTRRPPPPFTTSTLQAEASTRLRFDPDKTARIAQSLFEQGLVTYIRTDSTALSDEAIAEIRDYLSRRHPELLPKEPQRYADKAGAQGAHEAIRPVHIENPEASKLTGDEKALYELVLARTIACQAASAVIERTILVIAPEGKPWRLQAQGSVIKVAGFPSLQTVPDGTDGGSRLPVLAAGDRLPLVGMRVEAGRTKPPPRFTPASLIRYLERVRIGRPSTYAAILSTLLDRDYAKKTKQHLVPTDHGELADRLTRVSFEVLTQESFTATTEKSLDKISDGALSRTAFLTQFHRGLSQMLDAAGAHLADYATRHPELDRDAVVPHDAPCACGAARVRRKGKFGAYAQCTSEACGKRENLEPLKELADPCPDCGAAVVEQPYTKDGRSAVFYRCGSCAWRSSFKPPRVTKWPCHVDVTHGPMVEVTYEKEGQKRSFFLCRVCQNKAWTGPKPPACPLCKTPGMRLLDGPKGPFWGCAAYREAGCKGVSTVEIPSKQKQQRGSRKPSSSGSMKKRGAP